MAEVPKPAADTVPAALTPGETVLNKTQQAGVKVVGAVESIDQQKLSVAVNEALSNKKAKPVVIDGGPGPFCIYDAGLGSSGTLTIGGTAVEISRWDEKNIRGVIPEGVKGDVVLTTEHGVRRGVFPYASKG